MITLRKSGDRGRFQNDWLDSRYTFSFGHYHDPEHMGISLLRVINDDRVIPGAGFGTHPHRDMEIVTYILEGELEHRDSLGNGGIIRPHDVQRMSAGTGVTHSEFNPSPQNAVNFLQIWLLPKQRGVEPGYAQKHFPPDARRGNLQLLLSPDGDGGSLSANTDARLYGVILGDAETISRDMTIEQLLYVHVARGVVRLNDTRLDVGDGVCISEETSIRLTGQGHAEVLLFELPRLRH